MLVCTHTHVCMHMCTRTCTFDTFLCQIWAPQGWFAFTNGEQKTFGWWRIWYLCLTSHTWALLWHHWDAHCWAQNDSTNFPCFFATFQLSIFKNRLRDQVKNCWVSAFVFIPSLLIAAVMLLWFVPSLMCCRRSSTYHAHEENLFIPLCKLTQLWTVTSHHPPPLPLFTSGATGGGAREDGGGFLACDWPVLQHRFTGCLPWPVAVQRVAGLTQSVPGNDGNTAASQQAAACELAGFVFLCGGPSPSNPHEFFFNVWLTLTL